MIDTADRPVPPARPSERTRPRLWGIRRAAAALPLLMLAGVAGPVAPAASAEAARSAEYAGTSAEFSASEIGASAPLAAGRGPRRPAVTRLMGRPPSGGRWFSGVWLGGRQSTAHVNGFGRWRGRAADAVTTYPDMRTWASIANSTWTMTSHSGFRGRLVYSLPLLPTEQRASLADVARGRHDAVFAKVARDLRRHGRGNAMVRIGFEANGHWVPWGATAGSAPTFTAAYRRVAKVMKAAAPGLITEFDISCGTALRGGRHRLDALTRLYPGDDAVDVIGCDMYDEWQTKARNDAQWRQAVAPRLSPGMADVVRLARARGKGFAIPEWGVTHRGRGGTGDNPYFITAMARFMRQSADVLVLENYFDEPHSSTRSALWTGQNPRAAAAYRRLW